jgi:hypothetical protein
VEGSDLKIAFMSFQEMWAKKELLTYLPELIIFYLLFAVGEAGENTNKGKTVQNLFTRK